MAPHRVAQLTQSFRFDLANAFARDGERLPDLLERVIHPLADAEAHAQDALLARRERRQRPRRLLAQMRTRDRIGRRHGLRIRDEIAEVAVALVAERRL